MPSTPCTRSPWVQRALRHEIYAQPRGATFASRKALPFLNPLLIPYTGVTRNAEADDLPPAARDSAGRLRHDEEGLADGGDPTLDPAYPLAPDEDAECADSPSRRHESDRARWGDDICVWCLEDPTLPHVTGCVCGCQPDAPQHDDELPIDGTYYSDGSLV